MAQSPSGQWALPGAIDSTARWLAAHVPGTVAETLGAHGLWSFDDPAPLNGTDYWYHTQFAGDGTKLLRFEGLATIAEVYLNGVLLLASQSMFETHGVNAALQGDNDLHICFRALQPVLDAPQKRARWRPKLIVPASLRMVRTTALGHMPAWCPPVDCIGPWREITLCEADEFHLHDLDIRTAVEGTDGVLRVRVVKAHTDDLHGYEISCGQAHAALVQGADGAWTCELRLPEAGLWWPHTHGAPKLYPVFLDGGGWRIFVANTGFRTIALDRDADGDGFGLIVNGEPVFCRGANWTPPDLVRLPGTRAALAPQLERMRDAGMNMVRITGNMFYESDDFYALCAEMGLLVWQDFPFANFDYPAGDAAFTASVTREATQFLRRTQFSPALGVLCGGTETQQQAAMLGLPAGAQANTIFDDLLPRLAAALRPDAIYVPNSPSGGALPFQPNAGVSHYYGVSAYKRPLCDARLANVRFAAECLCFANVPDRVAVELHPQKAEILHHDFAPRVAFDAGAEWFFEDVRNHYLQALYDIDPGTLRGEDARLYLDLSRAASAEVMQEVFAEWRRPGSRTRGGLVWFLRDLWPGAGWGVLDFSGAPKAAYYGLKRAFAPVQVLLVDEGLNGLDVHCINETALAVEARLSLHCLQDGATIVMQAERAVTIAPRSSVSWAATELWGAFFDTTYAYRFGPPSHDATVATLARADGTLIAQAFHFPLGRGHARRDAGLHAAVSRSNGTWVLDLRCDALAQSVCIEDAAFEPEDNWFHLAPGAARRIVLQPRDKVGAALPDGHVRAVNARDRSRYGAMQCRR